MEKKNQVAVDSCWMDVIDKFIVDSKTQLGLINACFAQLEEHPEDFRMADVYTKGNNSEEVLVTGTLKGYRIIGDELFDNISQVVATLNMKANKIFHYDLSGLAD